MRRPEADEGANGRAGADAPAPDRDRPQGGSCGLPARLWVCLLAACAGAITDPARPDAGGADAAPPDARADAAVDAPTQPECEWGGAPGTCLTAAACAALPGHTAETGGCATGLACCILTPSVASNPPVPAGYKLMKQSDVTPAMTDWAVMILHDHVTYPMFATTTMAFGTLTVLARVEWHPPDFQNGIVHRGVTLYVPV
jgi:hypothetical protein